MTLDPKLLTGLGAAASIFLSSIGSAMGTAHSGVYAVRTQETQGIKGLIPCVISGVLAIYGIIVSVLLVGKFQEEITEENGYRNLCAGLSVGLACMASGMGIGKFIKQCNQQIESPGSNLSEATTPLVPGNTSATSVKFSPPAPNAIFLMVLCFTEAIGLYGLIVALFLMG